MVPLDDIFSFCCIICTTQLGLEVVVCKCAEGTFNPIIYDTDKDVKRIPVPKQTPAGLPLISDLHLNTEPLTTTLWL